MRYDGFISYSHFMDIDFAPAFQSGLHRLGKPWYRLRQLNIFRDETDLSATPKLWGKIEEALKSSEYLILLASPKAAASEWVKKEVRFWIDNKETNKIIIILTSGKIAWNTLSTDFDWKQTSSLPTELEGKFEMEPLYIDCTKVRKSIDLSLNNPQFKSNVAKVSAPIQGITVKELIDRDVLEHRKTILIRNIVISVILTFIAGLIITSIVILKQRNEARRIAKSSEYVVRALNKVSVTQSLSSIYQAYQLNPNPYIANLLTNFGENPVTFYKWIDTGDSNAIWSMAKEGNILYTGCSKGFIRAWDQQGKLLAVNELPVQSIDNIITIKKENLLVVYGYSPQNSKVFVAVLDNKTLKVKASFYDPDLTALYVTKDKKILTGKTGGKIRILNLSCEVTDSVILNKATKTINSLFQDSSGNFIVLMEEYGTNEAVIRKFTRKGIACGTYTTKENYELKKADFHYENNSLLAVDHKGTSYLWYEAGLALTNFSLADEGILNLKNDQRFGPLRFSPSGNQFIVTINDNCIIRQLNGYVNGKIKGIISLLTERIDQVEFADAEGKLLTGGSSSGYIFFWNYDGYLIETKTNPARDQVYLCKNMPTYCIQKNESFKIYNLKDNALYAEIKSSLKNCNYFEMISDVTFLIANDSCFQVLFKTTANQDTRTGITCNIKGKILFCDYKNNRLFSNNGNGFLGIYNLKTKKDTAVKVTKDGDILFVRVAPDGNVLTGGGEISVSGFIKIYSENLVLLRNFTGINSTVNDAVFSADGKSFSSVDDAGRFIKWNIGTGKQLLNTQIAMGIATRISSIKDGNLFVINGMIANEAAVIDKWGNKIQTFQFDKEVNDLVFIDKFRIALISGNSLYKVYTIDGFLHSERIASREKLEALEKNMDIFSINSGIRRQLIMQKSLK